MCDLKKKIMKRNRTLLGGFSNNINQFLPTVPTFAVRETDVSQHNGGTSGAPLNCSETIVLSEHYQQMLERWAWMD